MSRAWATALLATPAIAILGLAVGAAAAHLVWMLAHALGVGF